MSLVRQAVSGVKWNGVAAVVHAGVQFASMVVLARLLDPDAFGLISMVGVVTGFAQAFADFGLSNAIIHRQDATRQELSSLYWLNLVVGFSIFCILWLLIPVAVLYYREPRLIPLFRWSVVSFLIVPIGQQFQSLLRRELRFKALSLIQVTRNLANAVFAVGFALGGFGVMSLVWGNLISVLLGTTLLTVLAARADWLPMLHFRRADLRGFVRFGLFQMGERSLNYLSANVDYLIIGRFLGSEPLGFYTLVYNLMRVPLNYLNPVVVSVAFPAFARVQDQDDVLRRGYAKILHYLSAITFPVMAGMLVIAPLLVPLVYGSEWLPSVSVVQIFCLLGVLKSLGNPFGSLLLAKGRADLGFLMNLIAVLGYSASNAIGTRWGINGVAASSLIFACLILLPIDFYVRWLIVRMTLREYWQAISQPAAAALTMLIVVFPMYYISRTVQQDLVVLIVLVLAGAIVYSLMIRFLDRPLLLEIWGYVKPTFARKV